MVTCYQLFIAKYQSHRQYKDTRGHALPAKPRQGSFQTGVKNLGQPTKSAGPLAASPLSQPSESLTQRCQPR